MKDKTGITVTNAFHKILNQSNCKPNQIRVDKGSEFKKRSMDSWLETNDIEMYSTHNEGKSVIAERFIRTLKNKIYKYMTSISKNVYIYKVDDIVHNYNNTYHSTIKIKPVNIKSSTLVKKLIIKMLLVILKAKKLLECFTKNNCKKTNQKELKH